MNIYDRNQYELLMHNFMEENSKKIDWKKVLTFIVKLIELIIATFFGATLAGKINIF